VVGELFEGVVASTTRSALAKVGEGERDAHAAVFGGAGELEGGQVVWIRRRRVFSGSAELLLAVEVAAVEVFVGPGDCGGLLGYSADGDYGWCHLD
jgi:hypothetical protein